MGRTRLAITLLAAVAVTGCAGRVHFASVTPGAPVTLAARIERPPGPGPFPAVVILHGCHGVSSQLHRWALWLVERGYVALVVDSFGPRNVAGDCRPDEPDDLPNTARFDDAVGALRYLQGQPFVARDGIGVIGFSQGGVFAMATVNGPSLERARARGVHVPAPGFAASVAVYPGGCASLVKERVVRPLLVLMGAADDWTQPAPCQEMVAAMRARGAVAEIVLYPGAYHYFDVEDQPRAYLSGVGNDNKPGGCCGATVGYDGAAAEDARRRVEAFFGRHLRP